MIRQYRKFLGMLFIFLLIITIGITAWLVGQRQEIRSKATLDTAFLTFSPTTLSTNPTSNSFDVAVILNTGNQAVVGADILVQFDETKLFLVDVIKPPTIHSTFKTYAPITSNGNLDSQKIIDNANTNGIAEFGLLAFDQVTNTATPAFQGIMSPVITLRFIPRIGISGSTTIQFKYDETNTTTDSNIIIASGGNSLPEDILAAPTSIVSVQIDPGSSPVLQPSTSPGSSSSPSSSASATPTSSPSQFISNVFLVLNFEGIDYITPNKSVEFIFKQNSNTVYTENLIMSSQQNGTYTSSQAISIPSGTYDIYIDGPVHLIKKFTTTLTQGVNNLDFSSQKLLTGDAFDNDRVDIYDYSQLIAHFDSRYPTSGSTADLDLDQDVDIYDYGYLVGNFSKEGDQ